MKRQLDSKQRLEVTLTLNDVTDILKDMGLDENKSYLEQKELIKKQDLSTSSKILVKYLLDYKINETKKIQIRKDEINLNELKNRTTRKIDLINKFLENINKNININNNYIENIEKINKKPILTHKLKNVVFETSEPKSNDFNLFLQEQDLENFNKGKEIKINLTQFPKFENLVIRKVE